MKVFCSFVSLVAVASAASILQAPTLIQQFTSTVDVNINGENAHGQMAFDAVNGLIRVQVPDFTGIEVDAIYKDGTLYANFAGQECVKIALGPLDLNFFRGATYDGSSFHNNRVVDVYSNLFIHSDNYPDYTMAIDIKSKNYVLLSAAVDVPLIEFGSDFARELPSNAFDITWDVTQCKEINVKSARQLFDLIATAQGRAELMTIAKQRHFLVQK